MAAAARKYAAPWQRAYPIVEQKRRERRQARSERRAARQHRRARIEFEVRSIEQIAAAALAEIDAGRNVWLYSPGRRTLAVHRRDVEEWMRREADRLAWRLEEERG